MEEAHRRIHPSTQDAGGALIAGGARVDDIHEKMDEPWDTESVRAGLLT